MIDQSSIKIFKTQIQECLVTLTLHNEEFKICCIDEKAHAVYSVSFDLNFLKNADPTILSTFENLESMYEEMVEIAKAQPSDFFIDQQGTIRVFVTISMKSGSKKKQLVFETEKREMELAQVLQIEIQRNQKNREKVQKTLNTQISMLENKLFEREKENSELMAMITQMKIQMKEEVNELKLQINRQRDGLHQILSELRQSVTSIKQQLSQAEKDIEILINGFKRNSLIPDLRSHIFKKNDKGNGFFIQKNRIEKKGSSWGQIIFEEPIKYPKAYFQLILLKSKNNYICVGIANQQCLEQEDSKWDKDAITLFLLDNSIINQGKSNEEKSSEDAAGKVREGETIRVSVDFIQKRMRWEVEDKILGSVDLCESICEMGKSSKLRPLMIFSDEKDSALL